MEEETKSSKKTIIALSLILVAVVCCALTMLIGATSLLAVNPITSTELIPGDYFNQVAVIDIDGQIIGGEVIDLFGNITPDPVAKIISQLNQAANESTIKGVILRFNTPGGTVYDSFAIADAVREFKKSDKPIISLVETSAASGGYLIASQTDYIISNQTSIVGSIGVIAEILDTEGLLNKLGMQTIRITSEGAEQKAGGEISDPNSPEYKDLKELLNDYQKLFNEYVQAGRGFSDSEMKTIANGSIDSGVKAVKNGLVDELGGLPEAVNQIKELAKLSTDPQVVVFGQDEIFFGFGGLASKFLPGYFNRVSRGVEPLMLFSY